MEAHRKQGLETLAGPEETEALGSGPADILVVKTPNHS